MESNVETKADRAARPLWAALILACFALPAFAQTPPPEPPSAPAISTPAPRVASDAAAGDFAAARHLLQVGKFDEAIAQLLDLQSKNPATPGLARELGVAYYKKGEFLSAAKYLATAQSENHNDEEATQLLGLSYYLAGRPAQAIPQLEKVQTWYASANVDAAYILGICYIQSKDYPHARQAFAKMFSVGPDSAASYLFTARMLLRQDFGPVAEEYANKAASLDPKLPLAHELLGELYLYQSKIPEAIAQFQAELGINPGFAAA
ncbi:MAG: tetratricopeptide repeat protein, partial [Candidatus Acidiferrum sp.]